MIRTFSTHQIRPQTELSSSLWDFTPCQGEFAGKTYKVAVPSCWETYPDFTAYRGEGIYRTSFEAKGTIRLEFKGVSHSAVVSLNGKEIASHYNAFTPFSAIVKDLPAGPHILEVKVDNRFSEASALHIPNDYMTYGGISRAVALESISDVYITNVHVTPYTKDGIWHAKTEVFLMNISDSDRTVTVCVSLAGKSLSWENITVTAGQTACVSSDTSFTDVEEWMPEHPVLYTVKAEVSENGVPTDDLIDRFGFREVVISGKKILFNGKALRIKGFCRHEDHPLYGCALPYAAIAADLDTAIHLGANSIRTSHYPNDEIFLDLCDEKGILVWEENHARGLTEEHMRNPNFERQAEEVIREMIPAHYNHPSIYIWGILNECASETEYGKECYGKQYALIREFDQSRPRSSASCKFKTDICFGFPEVVSYNSYPQRYHDAPVDEYLSDLYQWVQDETEGSGKPFLITEIGAGAIYGYRAAHHPKWSEEYQAETLEKQIKAVLSQPGCSGIYIWQFCDVRISDEWFSSRPRTMNNKGIVDEYRRRKLSYDVVKRLYESFGNYFED